MHDGAAAGKMRELHNNEYDIITVMKKLSLAFFGAPSFAADVLTQILTDINLPVSVSFVVTQPDRKAGREQILTSTPVKLLAQKHDIPVFESSQLTTNHQLLKEIDLVLLYAFGEIISSEMLKMPKWGFWNIHPSLLPLYRGPSPIVYPLLMGDKITGTSLIQMDERLDHGQIIDQEEYSIQSADSQEILKKRLSDIGYKLFKKNIQILLDGALQKKDQDNLKATYSRLLTKKDGFVPYSTVQKIIKGESLTTADTPPIIAEYCKKYPQLTTNYHPPTTIHDLFRALSPWPGLWTLIPFNGEEKRLKITGMELKGDMPIITMVQLEGKKEVSLTTFMHAYASHF